MKKIPHLIKFFIRINVLILFSAFVAYTMGSFIYYYYHLKQDPMHYFSWWYGTLESFHIMQYIYYFIAFEVALLIGSIWYVWSHEEFS